MKSFLALVLVVLLGFTFAVPAPQQIAITLGQSFSLSSADSATFENMTFRLQSVTLTGDNPHVMVALTVGESEEAETLVLELPATSIDVGDYTLTLLGGSVPEDSSALCAVSRATLMLEKTEKPL